MTALATDAASQSSRALAGNRLHKRAQRARKVGGATLDATPSQSSRSGGQVPCPSAMRRAGEREGEHPRKDGAASYQGVISNDEFMRRNTGWRQSAEQWREGKERRDRLARETRRIADALEAEGIPARAETTADGEVLTSNVVALGEVTGEVDQAEAFRSICFLPLIAQRERRPVLNALRYFHRHDPLGKHMRLGVITAGTRVPLHGDLRGRMRKMHRDISRWAHEGHRDWNVTVLYRGTEFTIDDAGTVHPHANVLYAPRKGMPAHRWKAFLSWSHKRLGVHWHDAGRLEKPDEAIKYPFKPNDVEKLDSKALAWLYRETARCQLCQPMAEFAAFRAGLNRRRRKIVMVNRPGGARLEIVAKQQRGASDEAKEPWDQRVNEENAILCRTAPQFRFGPYAQPITLVTNYTENPTTEAGRSALRQIRDRQAQARQWWDENGAPDPEVAMAVARGQAAASEGQAATVAPFKVHTSRLTVQDDPVPGLPADPSEAETVAGDVAECAPERPASVTTFPFRAETVGRRHRPPSSRPPEATCTEVFR